MEPDFEGGRGGREGSEVHGREVLRELRLDGPPQEEVAPEAEENRLGARRGRLAPPLFFDAEEPGDEGRKRPRRLDEKSGARERVEAARLGPVGLQARRQGRVILGQPVEECLVEIREPVVAVEVLVGEAGNAEGKVAIGCRKIRW